MTGTFRQIAQVTGHDKAILATAEGNKVVLRGEALDVVRTFHVNAEVEKVAYATNHLVAATSENVFVWNLTNSNAPCYEIPCNLNGQVVAGLAINNIASKVAIGASDLLFVADLT